MATIKFLLQSVSANANIYIRFSINRNSVLKRKTSYTINPKDWNTSKGLPNTKSDDLKVLKLKLDRLATQIETAYNNDVSEGVTFDGDWLQHQIDIFNNKITIVELDILTNYIDKYINEAPLKKNQMKGLGLAESRIKGITTFKNLIIRFENEDLKGKKITIRQINIPFSEIFKKWLNGNGYSPNYIGKNIDNLKTMCFDAEKNGIEVSPQLKAIKSISENKEPEEIIYLSDEEQLKIKEATITLDSLNNARKWLLLGCQIGQRGGDLLKITESNIKSVSGNRIIELKQKKTGKLVVIPLSPEALQIIDSGLPHTISISNFSDYIKLVCKEAKIDNITSGRVKKTSRGATKIVKAPKHELISSHVCRRSFATNFYGKISTPVLMSITGHGTERMFLKYIGKSSYDSALQMIDYFNKLNK
jgi:integrase